MKKDGVDMKIGEILLEGGSGVLYHIVHVNDAVGMFDRAILAPSTNKAEIEHGAGRMFFLSTSRIPNNKYAKSSAGSGSVTFVLDGVKLGHRYKMKAMDYWGADYRKINRANGEYDYEAEDRILSDHPYIDNFSQYIEEVHICVNTGVIRDTSVRSLILKARRAHIPVYMYDDYKAFLILSKANRKKVSDFEFGRGGKEVGVRTPDNYVKKKNVFAVDFDGKSKVPTEHRPERVDSNLKSVKELLTKSDELKLSRAAKDYRHNYVWRGSMDSVHRLSADIHNAKSKKGSADYANAIDILRLMKANGLADYKAVVNFLVDKWR